MKETLQQYLPKGINLLQSISIPIQKAKLSQELVQANWHFQLQGENGLKLDFEKWEYAIKKIVNSKELIWIDTDKKGRSRKRDLKPELKKLNITQNKIKNNHLTHEETISIELQSLISPIGQSIKPMHIKHLLTKSLGHSITIKDIKRSKLILKKC